MDLTTRQVQSTHEHVDYETKLEIKAIEKADSLSICKENKMTCIW